MSSLPTDWINTILEYLSHYDRSMTKRNQGLLRKAIVQCEDQGIAQLLTKFKDIHIAHFPLSEENKIAVEEFKQQASSLHDIWKHQKNELASLVVQLLEIDFLSSLPSAYRRFPQQEQLSALRDACKSCQKAIKIIDEIERKDLANQQQVQCCRAFYLSQEALSYRICHQFEDAEILCGKACQAYEALTKPSKRNAKKYDPYLALARIDMALVLRDRLHYNEAKRFCEDALKFYEGVDSKTQKRLRKVHAIALHTFASILRGAGEYSLAKKYCQMALRQFRSLRDEHQRKTYRKWEVSDPYDGYIAVALTTLAGILRKLNQFETARLRCEEAAAYFMSLSGRQQQLYAPDKGMMLYTMGDILTSIENYKCSKTRDGKLYEVACSAYKSAIKIYEGINQDWNEPIFNHFLAKAHAKLGIALMQAGVFEHKDCNEVIGEAEKFFSEAQCHFKLAIELFENEPNFKTKASSLLDVAVTQCQYGLLYEHMNNVKRAMYHFEQCIKRCEKGLLALKNTKEHYDLHKSKIEAAYLAQIYHTAKQVEQINLGESQDISWSKNTEKLVTKLIGYLEAIRQEKAISSDFQEEDSPDQIAEQETLLMLAPNSAQKYKNLWQGIRDGSGQLWEKILHVAPERTLPFAFLWIQNTPKGVVFVLLRQGGIIVRVAESILSDKFRSLVKGIEQAWCAFNEMTQYGGIDECDARRFAAVDLPKLGEKVFQGLPEDIQNAIQATQIKTLIFSPCHVLANVPFEIIREPTPRKILNKKIDESYLGLRILTSRARSLTEFEEVVERTPNLSASQAKVLLVGNPHHLPDDNAIPAGIDTYIGTYQSLPEAGRFANNLSRRLKKLIYNKYLPPDLEVFSGKALTEGDAQLSKLWPALDNPGLCLWWQMGHGVSPAIIETGIRGSNEYLALAGGDSLYDHQLLNVQFPGSVVHLDCCAVGTVRGNGGGRFSSLPSSAITAGASAVLCSAYLMWVHQAIVFTKRFYAEALTKPCALGEALLLTRRRVAGSNGNDNNPLIWAPLVLWGNPWVKLYYEPAGEE